MAEQIKHKKLDVRFPAKMSSSDKCVCTACHGLGQVMQVKLPATLYRDRNNPVLATTYDDYWLCRRCREKLLYSLAWGCDDEDD